MTEADFVSGEMGQPPDPVVVVGLGPVGASLAGLLGRRGLPVIALEKEADVFPLPRAAHIDHTGLRTLQEIGCLGDLLPRMIPNPGLDFLTAAGEVLASIPGDQGSPSGLPASMYFHQPGFDRTLRETVASIPSVEVHLETEVLGVELGEDGAIVRASRNGEERSFDASYVVACDGAISPIREALDIPLADLDFHETWIVVDLKLLESNPALPDRALTYCDPARPCGIVPMPENRYRFELMLMPGEDPAVMGTEETVAELVSPWVSPGSAEVERVAVYMFHGLVASPWSVGRLLLAGDAAHQMPPFLGQGMNTGIRDAANLAWKLDMVVRGKASERILDTYEMERDPQVFDIVEAAVEIGRVVCLLDREEAERRDREMLADPNAARKLAFSLPRLTPGPLILESGGSLFPQPVLADGTRFDDVVGSRFLVLASSEEALGEASDWWRDQLDALVILPADLPAFEPALERILERREGEVVVVRPDRYILGVADRLDEITDRVRLWFDSSKTPA